MSWKYDFAPPVGRSVEVAYTFDGELEGQASEISDDALLLMRGKVISSDTRSMIFRLDTETSLLDTYWVKWRYITEEAPAAERELEEIA